MTYDDRQLKFIQKNLLALTPKLATGAEGGFKLFLIYSDYSTWLSHALLAGWSVEKETGKMYKQKENVRTYFN